jgi:hypothetical protein
MLPVDLHFSNITIKQNTPRANKTKFILFTCKCDAIKQEKKIHKIQKYTIIVYLE